MTGMPAPMRTLPGVFVQGAFVLVALGALLTSTGVRAANDGLIGLNTNRATLEFNANHTGLQSASMASTDSGVRLFGGFRLSQSISFETYPSTVGKFLNRHLIPAPDLALQVRPLGLGAAGRYAITQDFSLRGKWGLASVRSRESLLSGNLTNRASNFSVKPYLGIGLEYRLSPSWSLTSDYDVFSLQDGHRLRHISIGVGYGF